MRTKKIFVQEPNVIPPKSKDEAFERFDISDRFFALAKSKDGSSVETIAMYDFTRKKWVFLTSGQLELIEYYSNETPK